MFLNACAQDSLSGARWQSDWALYVAEVEKHIQRGEGPGTEVFKKTFLDRVVIFEGTLGSGEPNKVIVKMSPVFVEVPTRLFSPGNSPMRPARTSTADVLYVTPAAPSLELWKSLDVGAKIRFKAKLGDRAVSLVRTQTRNYHSVVILFEVVDAEIL
jgi:hypothetical protein